MDQYLSELKSDLQKLGRFRRDIVIIIFENVISRQSTFLRRFELLEFTEDYNKKSENHITRILLKLNTLRCILFFVCMFVCVFVCVSTAREQCLVGLTAVDGVDENYC